MEVVADASVVAKWYLIEDYRKEAIKLRDDFISGFIEITSTSIMPFEVLNAIKWSKNTQTKNLGEIAESLNDYDIKLYGMNEIFEKTASISTENNISVYDASYIALSLKLNAALYTADESLIKAVKGKYKITHIKDY